MTEKIFARYNVSEYFPSHSLPGEVKIHEVWLSFSLLSPILEVGPRDGLQNETEILSVDHRIELIERY
jgi:hydroxymethylglutaryl-CoA lyase